MPRATNHRLRFVLGGARSGKSAYAERRAQAVADRKAYIATCPKIDDEISERIAKHRESRAGKGWITVEEPLSLVRALEQVRDYPVVLVDCLTLWVNNLLYTAGQRGERLSESRMQSETDAVLDAARAVAGEVFFVSNEVGLGIVPGDAESRLYRDLVGRCNQRVAQRADEVVFLVAGIAQQLKTEASR